MKTNIRSDNRHVLVLSSIIVLISILVFANAANVDTSQDWHPVQQIAKSTAECYAIDGDDDGIIDKADALPDGPDPDPVQYVDTNKPWHPLQQISTGPSSSTSIDDDGNGWPDVCESLAEPGTTTAAGVFFHPIFQISRSSSDMQSVDSDGSGWPDKCDCVLSELNTDINNCGSCGTVCSTGTTPACCSGACKDLDSDASNCGTCGTVCGSNAHCSGGACACDTNHADCDSSWDNGCECDTSGGLKSCYGGACCTRSTCASGWCGSHDDGCGGAIDCGGCPPYWDTWIADACSGQQIIEHRYYYYGGCSSGTCTYSRSGQSESQGGAWCTGNNICKDGRCVFGGP